LISQVKFLEELSKYLNTLTKCYYEEAPKNAIFPYVVLVPPSTSDLSYGTLSMFDLEVYTNELGGGIELEGLCDTLVNGLKEKTLNLSNYFNSHISFENYINLKDNEQDLICRRLTFSARIIYK
jgi:hypothetical protein